MSVAFLFAATLSSNPLLLVIVFALVLAWRIAGYYGLDFWVLPWLGAPHGEEFCARPVPGAGASRPRGASSAILLQA